MHCEILSSDVNESWTENVGISDYLRLSDLSKWFDLDHHLITILSFDGHAKAIATISDDEMNSANEMSAYEFSSIESNHLPIAWKNDDFRIVDESLSVIEAKTIYDCPHLNERFTFTNFQELSESVNDDFDRIVRKN
jgi:hypothetical protein